MLVHRLLVCVLDDERAPRAARPPFDRRLTARLYRDAIIPRERFISSASAKFLVAALSLENYFLSVCVCVCFSLFVLFFVSLPALFVAFRICLLSACFGNARSILSLGRFLFGGHYARYAYANVNLEMQVSSTANTRRSTSWGKKTTTTLT